MEGGPEPYSQNYPMYPYEYTIHIQLESLSNHDGKDCYKGYQDDFELVWTFQLDFCTENMEGSYPTHLQNTRAGEYDNS